MEGSYEDLSETKHHAMAGALTGFVEFSLMYPLDMIKTRMQTLRPKPEATYESVVSSFSKIKGEEGFYRLYRGMPAPLLASLPAHACYFMTYEKMKRLLSGTADANYSPIAQGLAGAMAVVGHNVVMNPADVVKQRMQVYGSPYRSTLQCLKSVVRKEGIRALYRSLPTQLTIDAPYGALHFMVYEFCQNLTNPTRAFDAPSHMFCGAVAGGFAAAATTPLDVCRTLINTQEGAALMEAQKSIIRGLPHAIVTVYKLHGIRGFFRGIRPRVLHHVPSTAICWLVYEFFKRYFVEKNHSEDR